MGEASAVASVDLTDSDVVSPVSTDVAEVDDEDLNNSGISGSPSSAPAQEIPCCFSHAMGIDDCDVELDADEEDCEQAAVAGQEQPGTSNLD